MSWHDAVVLFKSDSCLKKTVKMIKAFATILLIVGASVAYPADEDQRPLPEQLSASLPDQSQDLQPLPEQTQQDLEPLQPGQQGAQKNPDDSDLKTDATFWFGRSFYPYGGYRRSYSYYRPRARYYSYYNTPSYAPYYSSWYNYW